MGVFLLVAAGPVPAQSVHRATVEITVGPNVQVSRAFDNVPHYENLAAGNVERSGNLLICSMVSAREVGKEFLQYCYLSSDSGKTWHVTLRVTEGRWNGDPTVIYGRGGIAYVVSLVDLPGGEMVVVNGSSDAGHTWRELSRFRSTMDRPFIVTDNTNGRYAHRVYIVGTDDIKGLSGSEHQSMVVFRSIDGGRTFQGPIELQYPEGLKWYFATGQVLSDGTLVVMLGYAKRGDRAVAELWAVTSGDGGETFGEPHKIANWPMGGGGFPQLAVDSEAAPFKDRLYTVFPATVSGRIQIQSAHSSDKGATWSEPLTINDDRSPERGGSGPDHSLPSVAVNKNGVVLVTWYDRRETHDDLGWRLRAAASLDGGETFSASVPVAGYLNTFSSTIPWDLEGRSNSTANGASLQVTLGRFFLKMGHTSGLAVDADGTFHTVWIDNRLQVPQLWSASLEVKGAVAKHGAADLAKLDDVSGFVRLESSTRTFDQSSGTLSITVQLRNTSKFRITGPLKVRLLSLESDVGIPEAINMDNQENGTGAIWDFSRQLSGGSLSPMSLSSPRTLSFHLSDVRSLGFESSADNLLDGEKRDGVIRLKACVLGRLPAQ